MAQPTFTFIGDEEIRNIIGSARESVIFAAPSLSAKIANAFRKNADLNKDISQRIIVDADAKALRHGFGELKGLKDVADIGVDLRTLQGCALEF